MTFFCVTAVKLTAEDASWKEISDLVEKSLDYNPDTKYVARGLDLSIALSEKDSQRHEGLPDYMSDEDALNDINYLLDKRAMFISVIDFYYTIKGIHGTTMDEYTF